jgi:integrase
MSFESCWSIALREARILNFRFHDLRHCCASYLAQQGASLVELADVLGHRTMAMVKRYAHLSTDSKRRLVNRVLGDLR